MKRTPPAANPGRTPWALAMFAAGLGLLTACVLWAPARWLGSAIGALSAERVQLADPRGTLWQGSAALVLTGGEGSRDRLALPGRLHWQWRWPASSGWTAMGLQVQADCCMPAPTVLRLQGWPGQAEAAIDKHDSQWPASLLAGLGAPWNTLQPEGQLRLHSDGLRLQRTAERWQLQGTAELDLQDMSSRLSTLRPMGSYRLRVQGGTAPALAQIELNTLSGSLKLSGQGQWVDRRLRFQGEASATSEHEAALSNLLNIIGRRQGSRSLLSLG